jgi:molecular chaperone GrpE
MAIFLPTLKHRSLMKHKENSKHEHEKKPEPAAQPVGDKADSGVSPATEPAVAPPPASIETGEKAPDDRLLRLQADFDNFRKRVMRERAEIYKRANEDLMVELFSVLDHLQMALEAAVTHDAPKVFAEGFQNVSDQLNGTLAKFGLEPVEAAGRQFDPNEHEAISHIPSDTVPESMVITQTRRGYRLAGHLLRPAQVVVSSGKPAAASVPGPAEDRKA